MWKHTGLKAHNCESTECSRPVFRQAIRQEVRQVARQRQRIGRVHHIHRVHPPVALRPLRLSLSPSLRLSLRLRLRLRLRWRPLLRAAHSRNTGRHGSARRAPSLPPSPPPPSSGGDVPAGSAARPYAARPPVTSHSGDGDVTPSAGPREGRRRRAGNVYGLAAQNKWHNTSQNSENWI